MLNPDIDKYNWQTPEQCGKLTVFVVTQTPTTFTGRILTAEDIEQEMAALGWKL